MNTPDGLQPETGNPESIAWRALYSLVLIFLAFLIVMFHLFKLTFS